MRPSKTTQLFVSACCQFEKDVDLTDWTKLVAQSKEQIGSCAVLIPREAFLRPNPHILNSLVTN